MKRRSTVLPACGDIARPGVDLTERCNRLLQQEGDQVQDQRFAAGPPAPFAPLLRPPAGQAPPSPPTIVGYPAGMFPYCVLIDAEGRVAAHGLLSEMLPTLEGMLPREKTPAANEPVK